MLADSALRQQWYRNMAVPITESPAVGARLLITTFVTTLIFHSSVADIAVGASTTVEAPHRRFEYKYSFKGPHLSQSDGGIPFWIHTGSKFVSSCQHHWTAARQISSTAVCPAGTSTAEAMSCLWFVSALGCSEATAACFVHSQVH